ncbi:MAG: DUF423 domain-containing protein [Lutibacter sp.]|uniref:DUF423 domain-containing protein n=1 Tax=Lutibacter sp. TaxID=1925666 RepID=UPI0017B0A1D1|nr:DUF423 domain-containing protein [Lutibacter sp.]MBT8317351.1 DUF423 domain-containing protein [Lutibacter sp.]NNJ58210.1 DUF423 domain-containing protein [Lutibacter sp.]
MNKNLVITSLLGAITILLGAFGAHALKEILDESALKSFETAVRYQMYHVLVLLVVNTYPKFSAKSKNIISYLFFSGILFFSGSIYVITFGVNAKSIWFITPLGGLLFVLGWLKMAMVFFKKAPNK